MYPTLNTWCTLPTAMGSFRMYDTGNEYVRIICLGDIYEQGEQPMLRVHSSCLASEVFGALDCDCADQLKEAMKLIATEGRGIIIHLHQEGRGHGLSLKIQAVRIMEKEKLDTTEAFNSLGLDQDVRSYTEAVSVLQHLGINSVRLISNNPRKAKFLQQYGIQNTTISTHPNIRPENAEYLQTKNNKLGHQLPISSNLYTDEPIHFYHSDQPWGELSNFSLHSIFLNNRIWPTVEHFYQAQKFSDPKQQEEIRCCATPILAKKRAYELADIHGLTDWIHTRELVMLKALRAKFDQHPDLQHKILQSGQRYLMEFTDNDKFWGDNGDGFGLNRLGHLLMQVRDELQNTSVAKPLAI